MFIDDARRIEILPLSFLKSFLEKSLIHVNFMILFNIFPKISFHGESH
jgi:hypothetical protein